MCVCPCGVRMVGRAFALEGSTISAARAGPLPHRSTAPAFVFQCDWTGKYPQDVGVGGEGGGGGGFEGIDLFCNMRAWRHRDFKELSK